MTTPPHGSDTEDLRRFIHIALDDLRNLAQHDANLVRALFFNRVNEIRQFEAAILGSDNHHRNILVIGEAGVGKSTFLSHLAEDADRMRECDLFPVLVDFAAALPKNDRGCLLQFVRQLDRYFTEMHCPIHTLQPNTEASLDANIVAIKTHMAQNRDLPRRLGIFIDDLDYAEEHWFTILDALLPFASHPQVSLILSVRPMLLASIQYYDERFRFHYESNASRIYLRPLSVPNLLVQRLAPMLVKKEHSLLDPVLRFFDIGQNPLCKLARKLGVKHVEDLPKMDYPLTKRHDAFMLRITNGDLRELFAIAITSLEYVISHDSLDDRLEEGMMRRVIGREGVMAMFYDDLDAIYRILNLHERQSRNGNSAHFNCLEAIKIHQSIDDKFYGVLEDFGHKPQSVPESIKWLQHRSRRLIRPKYAPNVRKICDDDVFPQYEITEKGRYYLEIANWDEYKARCPYAGRSVCDEYEVGPGRI
jgi:hypothetical protein